MGDGPSSSSDRSAAPSPRGRGHLWRFGDCEFDARRRELRVRGVLKDVESKPLDVLYELLLNAGEVVTREELFDAVWPGVAVVDSSLATAVSKLRRALEDEGLIVTVPKVGYRLGATVRLLEGPDTPVTDLRLEIGQPVPARPQWRLERRLDVSPSSDVWLAQHDTTGERRVFKFAPDAEHLRYLKREVTVARLLHDVLGERREFVRVLEWNFAQPPYFVESEYRGPNFAEWAAAHGGLAAIPLPRRLALFVEIARAVAAAHEVGVLHKDLKPTNILISEQTDAAPHAVVADFGCAVLLSPSRLNELGITRLGFTRQTEVGAATLAGTPFYVAPEVLAGQAPTPASDVYALGVLLYQLAAGDFRRPCAPGWEADVSDPFLREDIASAANGDAVRRLQSAGELATRVDSLARRQQDAEHVERTRRRQQRRKIWGAWAVLGAVAALLLVAAWTWSHRTTAPAAPRLTTVAILPFDNLGNDADRAFLQMAIPDEVATVLSHTRGVSVRPLASTERYDAATVDVQMVGRDLRVAHVVTGRFHVADDRLRVTLEATSVASDTVTWRDTFDIPANNLTALQTQLMLRVRERLAPAIGGGQVSQLHAPASDVAYELYLRSIAVGSDPTVNQQGVALLERSVAIDPAYPPAWVQLGRRYYTEARYGAGNESLMAKADVAFERAAQLDPYNATITVNQAGRWLENGDAVRAFKALAAAADHQPESADAHFGLSYVFRYVGLLPEAAEECEKAYLLDAMTQGAGVRSCAVVSLMQGDYSGAMTYLQLDSGTEFKRALSMHILARQGKRVDGAELGVPDMPQWTSYGMLHACLAGDSDAVIAALAARVVPSADPELNYFAAAHLAYCGQDTRALDMLARAVDGGYCAVPALDADPLFERVRATPEFATIRARGRDCQNRFLDARKRPS